MKRYRCLDLLDILSASQRTALRKFVASPYFRVSEPVQALLQYLLKCGSGCPGEWLGKPALHRRLFGKEIPYKEKRIRDLLSDAALVIEEFLATERIRSDRVLRRRLAAEATAVHPDRELLHQELTHWERAVEKAPNRSLDYYREKSALHALRGLLPLQSNLRNERTDLDDWSVCTRRYLALEKTRLLFSLLNRQRVFDKPYELTGERDTLDYLEAQPDDPVARLYWLTVQNFHTPTLAGITEAFDLCRTHLDRFAVAELVDITAMLSNATYRIADAPKADCLELGYRMDTFTVREIFSKASGALIEAGRLRTMYGHAVMTGRGRAVADYIQQLYAERGLRSPDHLDNLAFILAYQNFQEGNIALAADHIRNVNLNNPDLGAHGRSLQIRIYFTLFEEDPDRYRDLIESTLDAYDKYVRRYNKSNLIYTKNLRGVIKCYRLLFSIKTGRKGLKKNILKLREQISKIHSPPLEKFIREQVGDL